MLSAVQPARISTALRGNAGSPRVSSVTSPPNVHSSSSIVPKSTVLRDVSTPARTNDPNCRSARAFHSTRCSRISKCGLSRFQMPMLDWTRDSGPVSNARSNSSAARRVPPHVSGTDSRSPNPSRSLVLTRPPYVNEYPSA